MFCLYLRKSTISGRCSDSRSSFPTSLLIRSQFFSFLSPGVSTLHSSIPKSVFRLSQCSTSRTTFDAYGLGFRIRDITLWKFATQRGDPYVSVPRITMARSRQCLVGVVPPLSVLKMTKEPFGPSIDHVTRGRIRNKPRNNCAPKGTGLLLRERN